jgi:uncharacterized protein YjbJ (UPF0337 family)
MSNASNSSPDATSGGASSLPSADALKSRWQQRLVAAKLAWGKLTDDELLQLKGHAEKLTGLVQERYALTLKAAAQRVRTFYDKHLS